MEVLVGAVDEWRRGASRYLDHQNEDALRVVLHQVLGLEVERLTGLKLKVYLGHVIATLKRLYEVSSYILSSHIADIIDEATPVRLVACFC